MLTVSQARERVLAQLRPVGTEKARLADCAGRVLAQDVTAAIDLPTFDNSSMDGFAVRAADTDTAGSPASLRVVGDIRAGESLVVTLHGADAARIMTGGQLPAGADAVVPVEDTDFNDRSAGTPPPSTVMVHRKVSPGEFVRAKGQDVRVGQTVLRAGHTLRPQDAGVLAMLGVPEVTVFRRPRVALIASGDELVEVGAELPPGKVYDSNTYSIGLLIVSAGAELIGLAVAKDTAADVQQRLERAVQEHAELIVSTAGVSVGAFDFVRHVVSERGTLGFWRVNMRPGKPVAFGSYGGVPFLGLPGNPVSAFIVFEVFVRDAIGRLAGRELQQRQRVRVQVTEEIESDGRESYLRAVVEEVDGSLVGRLTGHQGSGNLFSLVQANALLIIPAGVKCVPAKREVDAWLI